MIYFRGCVVRDRLPQIETATKKVLDTVGVEYHILDDEECCGSFLLRTGFTDDAREVMTKTLENLKGEKILVSCAGCYNTLKNDYKRFLGVELDVIHTSQLFESLIKEGKIKPKKLPIKTCYHDPCHLGRHCGEYEAPRSVLRSITHLEEMENIKEKARCCGSGGGVKAEYPNLAYKLARKRIEDALKTDAEIMVTACSFCLINLIDARENLKNNDKASIPVMDLSEILLWAVSNEIS